MKDWQRSPEPPGMMGGASRHRSRDPSPYYGTPERDMDPVISASQLRTFQSEACGSHHAADDEPAQVDDVEIGNSFRSRYSLASMCKRVILRNMNAVQDVGDMPFRIARDILEQCRVDQLILLEENSPHLLEHTDSIWKRNCLRDFVQVRKKYEENLQKEPSSWRRLYLRKQGEIEEQKAGAAQRIKDRYASHRAEKESKKLVVSDTFLGKTPKRGGNGGWGSITPVTKGQSLINKARHGSAAQARLTLTKPATRPSTIGRARAVVNQLAPGMASGATIRPMVAPKRVTGIPIGLKDAVAWTSIGEPGSNTSVVVKGKASSSPAGTIARSTSPVGQKWNPTSSPIQNGSVMSKSDQGASLVRRQTPGFLIASKSEQPRKSVGAFDFFGKSPSPSSSTSSPILTRASKSQKRPGSGIVVPVSKVARTGTATSPGSTVETRPSRSMASSFSGGSSPSASTGSNSNLKSGEKLILSIGSSYRSPIDLSKSPEPDQPLSSQLKERGKDDSVIKKRHEPVASGEISNRQSPSATSSIFMPRNRATSQLPRVKGRAG
ncbi:hypothetical protein IE53DRAFT_168960 [Violaceomyces palustris]|uniref:Uncharacterized protein n=1 Tax=Violaceomyces palustris TaxID=1673888 RepID=A0ACD0NT99_9BASI|nr:hypothetical protein IE53DRAFT_168960 [Violaceomyces palustris]